MKKKNLGAAPPQKAVPMFGPLHIWERAHGGGTRCGLKSAPGMVGTVYSLHLVTCRQCEEASKASAAQPPPEEK
jgi:hypothetical protein